MGNESGTGALPFSFFHIHIDFEFKLASANSMPEFATFMIICMLPWLIVFISVGK